MRSHHRVGWILSGLLCLGMPSLAFAEDAPRPTCPICRNAASNQSADYQAKATHTLVRGVTNTFFGWTEVIRQPAEEVKAGGNLFTGILKGIGQGVGRTAAGAGEILTFWTPKGKNGYVHFATDCPICMKRPPPK